MKKPAILFFIFLLICIFGSGFVFKDGSSKGPLTPVPANGAVLVPNIPMTSYENVRRPENQTHPSLDAALARAVAALGLADDGDNRFLMILDNEAQGHLDDARILLDSGPTKHIKDAQPVQSDGVIMQAGVSEKIVSPTQNSDLVPHTHAPVIEAPAEKVATILHNTGPVFRNDGPVKIITASEIWAAIPYDPQNTAGAPLILRNSSSGAYVISLHADDASSIRLNGGLIVPGRSYLLDGDMFIQSTMPVGIHLRPLAAVPAWWPEPIYLPVGKG